MQLPRVILVGGFLGAGKTTLVGAAARQLAARGLKVGIITNDQAADLVDTGLLRNQSADVAEVAGGCFCCRFTDFISELQRMNDALHADVLIGEPVGSCTDLSATVIQPLKQLYTDAFRTAPFSVLVDPSRYRQAMGPRGASGFPDNVLYIYRLQIEEADAIVLNKVDQLSPQELAGLRGQLAERYPGRPIFPVSALTGQGVDAWLAHLLDRRPAGQRIAEVDYRVYADGEAALGWLNASVRMQGKADWAQLCKSLLVQVQGRMNAVGAEIAHAKALLTCGSGWAVVNLTDSTSEPSLRSGPASAADEATLVINVRAHINPESLRAAVLASLQSVTGSAIRHEVTQIQSFSPSPPRPEHRYKAVIA